MKATIFVKPLERVGEQWGIHFGDDWNDPDRFTLLGFESAWDAWAFCICNGLNDPIVVNKHYTYNPPEIIEQPRLL